MHVLKILKDEELSKEVCKPVYDITEDIKLLCVDLCTTMKLSGGIGLSAPQVGKLLRIIVVDTATYNSTAGHICNIMINPKIVSYSTQKTSMVEGCLSFPGKRQKLDRPKEIEVEWMNTTGELLKSKFFGLAARVIMHEVDHLDGITMFDEEGYKI